MTTNIDDGRTPVIVPLDAMLHQVAHQGAREDALKRGDDPETSCCRGHCAHFEAELQFARELMVRDGISSDTLVRF